MRLSQMKMVAKEQVDFPKYQALPALLTTISVSLPVIIVTKFFGVVETSYFDLSRMVLLVPSTLIATAVSQVLFQNISERINQGKPISSLILKTSSILVIIAVLVITIMYIAGPYLFGIVFDQSYRISGEYARILSVAFMFQFIGAPVSITLTALKKLKVQALWQASYFLVMIILLFSDYDTVNHFYWTFTIVNIIAYSAYWSLTFFQARIHDKRL
jgi:O-antigen/teichoic acid export membrane protein